ncbi:HD-GYP domain-containing protein [Desulfolutivibrio sp.]|uniref:HD-GYP domain-containing protein n=1 Tax=Desulfolutivibrio sp. TaxID=2773296 RepID=UPI002F961E55
MIVKMDVNRLAVGMYVVDTGLSWLEYPYLFSSQGPITSEKTIQAITSEGYAEAFIDTQRSGFDDDATRRLSGGTLFKEAFTGQSSPASASGISVPMAQELPAARKVYEDALAFAKDFIHKAYQEKSVDFERSEAFVSDVISSVSRNRETLTGLCKLRFYDEYSYTHSINVTVLATAFGQYLGLPGDELHPLGLGALFHDIGKANIPREVLNKPGRLDAREFQVIKRHPLESYVILKGMGALTPKVLSAIVEHHEKYDGSGYPRGIGGEEVSMFARIISLADVYDALTSERVYKKGMPPAQALGVMYGMREKDFHPTMVERFIKCLGIYPVGSFVRLSDSRYGLVWASNALAPLFPTVKAAFDDALRPIPAEFVDLAEPGLASAGPPLTIAEAVDPRRFNIDISAVMN